MLVCNPTKTHSVMAYKYDVFISYSRKDYMDENKNIIPGNVISTLKDSFEKNGISYWMDEKGDMTGKKFAAVIAKHITESNVFLFVCTHNSVASKWVDRELGVADDRDKHIIPFACDESYRDDKVIMFTGSHDRIDYFMNPDKEMKKLIEHILKKKAEAQIEEEIIKKKEEEERKKREEEEKRNAIKEEIKTLVAQFHLNRLQQESIINQLHDKNLAIGNSNKICPICGKRLPVNSVFCDRCGFQFPSLYSLDGNKMFNFDQTQILLCRSVWNGAEMIGQLESRISELQVKNKSLEATIRANEKERAEYKVIKTCFASQKKLIDELRKKNSQLEESVSKSEAEVSEYKLEIRKVEDELIKANQQLSLNKKELEAKNKELTEKETLRSRIYSENKELKRKNDRLNSEIKKQKTGCLNESIEISDSKIKSSILELIGQSSNKKVLLNTDKVAKCIDLRSLSEKLKSKMGIVLSSDEMQACSDIATLLNLIANVYKQEQEKKSSPNTGFTNSNSKKASLSLRQIDSIIRECQKNTIFRGLNPNARVHDINLRKLSEKLSVEYRIDISVEELELCSDIQTLRNLIYNLSKL